MNAGDHSSNFQESGHLKEELEGERSRNIHPGFTQQNYELGDKLLPKVKSCSSTNLSGLGSFSDASFVACV
jgi:hypothetical protein